MQRAPHWGVVSPRLAPQRLQVTMGSVVSGWATQGPGGGGHSGPEEGRGAGPGKGIGDGRGEGIGEVPGEGTGRRRGEGTGGRQGAGAGVGTGVREGGGPSTCGTGEVRCGGRSRITATPRLLPRTILLLPSTSTPWATPVEELSSVALGREGEEEVVEVEW